MTIKVPMNNFKAIDHKEPIITNTKSNQNEIPIFTPS